MERNEDVLEKVLRDRERRAEHRLKFAEQGTASVSLNFNVPGYPKSSESIHKAFLLAVEDLQNYFVARRVVLSRSDRIQWTGDCGDFFIQSVEYDCSDEEMKNHLEQFEMEHKLGRLLDVDLCTDKGDFVSSGKMKKCFLCEEPARECMKEERHNIEEFQECVKRMITEFLEDHRRRTIVDFIGSKALESTLWEVSLEGKPGLVCPSSRGAHTDMDYSTFLVSSSALSPHWIRMASYGYDCGQSQQDDYKAWKIYLRILGLEAEKTMYLATGGINTQKGIVFLLGLACFSTGFSFARKGVFDITLFRKTVQGIMNGVVAEDFSSGKAQYGTHGEQCFQHYGSKVAGGARGEAEQGFPSVFSYALDFLQSQTTQPVFSLDSSEREVILLDLLLLIISRTLDTNVLYRKGQKALSEVQDYAQKILSLDDRDEKTVQLNDFRAFCVKHNISSGGAADLLALTVFIHSILSNNKLLCF